ncbi:hypothetical protein JJB09_14230 [Rhizobium sp. KVB221]|uniref:Uncharacterized protein n=1 Tax=Rhizobium setariae TaxID=2801340 RepID=A0A937CLH2_9HYPH|nr:hypothetical protein [Rhizobium setariae]MBL0373190.1 hypothetical protein [Rhizobium setariae]
MSILAYDPHYGHSARGNEHPGFIASLRKRWSDYRMMREIESVPFDVMKDVGFRAPDSTNEK